VLDLSKIEAGQLVLSLNDYSIKDMMQGVYVAVEPLAGNKKLNFKLEVPPDLPPARGDERRLSQVLLNLVGNAIKFTDTGEVALKASTANGSYTVAVADTGPGIAEADQAKIFEEFQQSESAHTKAKGGTGLGLAIAKAAGSGSNRALVPARHFSSPFHCASNMRRGRHEQAHSGGRRSTG
jgi:signal transduction histidine kinase